MAADLALFPDLRGKHVFITGGGSGIGAGLTKGFLQNEANVTYIQRTNNDNFCDLAERETGKRPLFVKGDLTDVSVITEAVEKAHDAFGKIDVLINNAAWDNRHTLDELAVEDWDTLFNINLRPHFFAAQKIVPDMVASGRGAIINVSSISYIMGNSGYPAYASAKAGIVGLTRSLARELGDKNIRVNALVPGWVMTDRQKELWVTDEGFRQHIDRQCLKKPIEVSDMVGPALFLASNISSMITSQALVVDGGVVMTG